MKKKRISTYITLLTLLSSMLLYSPTLAAQEKKTTIEEEKVPWEAKFLEVTLQVQKSAWRSI